jgi:branched-chain amino acid transport system permease protein
MWKGAAEPNLFDIPLSFQVLFIAIIGGLGSILGNYLGAILIVGLPVVLNPCRALSGSRSNRPRSSISTS